MGYAITGLIAIIVLALSLKGSQIQIKTNESFYNNLITEKANDYGLEFALVKAIVKKESDFDPNAKNPLDPSYGLMQITPGLAYDWGLVDHDRNLSDEEIATIMQPENNVEVGAWFLGFLFSRLAFSGAVQAYNLGYQGYLKGKRNYDYLNKVMEFYNDYSKKISS